MPCPPPPRPGEFSTCPCGERAAPGRGPECTRTRRWRTEAMAASWVHACVPVPMSPRSSASGLAEAHRRRRRRWRRCASDRGRCRARARTRPVRASWRTTTCSPGTAPKAVVASVAEPLPGDSPAVTMIRRLASWAWTRGGATRRPSEWAMGALRNAATASPGASAADTSASVNTRAPRAGLGARGRGHRRVRRSLGIPRFGLAVGAVRRRGARLPGAAAGGVRVSAVASP